MSQALTKTPSPRGQTIVSVFRRIWLQRRYFVLHAVLVLWMCVALLPIVWGISSSFKGRDELYKTMPSLLPKHPILDNYRWVIGQMGNVPRYFRNSVIVSAGTVAIKVVIASLAGYAFARLRFKGRDLIFHSLVMVMFVPRAGGLMASYELMNFLNLRNSLIGLILAFSGRLSVAIFIMRQAFLAVPVELEDAARIDGANRWQLFWTVAAPLTTGAMIVVGLFTFIDVWGEYLFTITMLDQNKLFTMAVGVAMHTMGGVTVQAEDVVSYGANAAVYLIAAYPVMLLFVITQRYFVRGLMEGALKF